MRYRILTLNNISVRGPGAPAARPLRGRLRDRPAGRDAGALRRHARDGDAGLACWRWRAPAPAPTTFRSPRLSRARHPGVQRARRQRQRRQGTGDRRRCSSPRATSARPGSSRARSAGDDEAIDEAVEKGKKDFVGFELPGRTLGVVGLGAIGVEVANCALALGMKVLGYDPQITVQRAWQLSSGASRRCRSTTCSRAPTSSPCTCR